MRFDIIPSRPIIQWLKTKKKFLYFFYFFRRKILHNCQRQHLPPIHQWHRRLQNGDLQLFLTKNNCFIIYFICIDCQEKNESWAKQSLHLSFVYCAPFWLNFFSILGVFGANHISRAVEWPKTSIWRSLRWKLLKSICLL